MKAENENPFCELWEFRNKFCRIVKKFYDESHYCNDNKSLAKVLGISKKGAKAIMNGEADSLEDIIQACQVIDVDLSITINLPNN